MDEVARKTILIVDNDRSVRDLLVHMVEQMGHQTVAVERATRAINILKDQVVDAMLLDLHMPGPHGQDLLHYLKKRNIIIPPTLVVSGYLKQESIDPLIQLGVCGILAKPFDGKRLRDELGRLLEGQINGQIAFCSQCGAPAKEDVRFCSQCGHDLKQQHCCPHCDASFDSGDQFCSHCGEGLSQA